MAGMPCPPDFVLDQKDRIAGCVLGEIPGQGSSDAILPSASGGADLKSDGLAMKVWLLCGGRC